MGFDVRRRDYRAAPRPLNAVSGARPIAAVLCAASILLTAGCAPRIVPTFAVWAVGETTPLTLDARPQVENRVYSQSRGEIRLTSAINETVAFQLALQTGQPPVGPFDVSLGDLAGPAGVLRAADVVRQFHVLPVRVEEYQSWYPRHTGLNCVPRQIPDLCVPWDAPRGGGPLRLDDNTTQIVWFDVRVPPTTAPGEYTGTLAIGPPGAAAWTTRTVRLRVVPVALPGERSLPLICRVDPTDLLREQLNWPVERPEQTRLLPEDPRHKPAVQLVNATMRLLHEHRATPVLWGSFPKYRPSGPREVEIEWGPYDALVGPWLDGSAFGDRVGVAAWPIPVSGEYPTPPREGGLDVPAHARFLAAYLSACRAHFAERGWLDRSFVRLTPPGPLDESSVAAARRAALIVQQSEAGLPLLVHLPPESLRKFGWEGAPAIDLRNVSIWSPPAEWLSPEDLRRETNLGRRVWFRPDRPPFCGALDVEAPAADTWSLPWQAWRYDCEGIWIEDAAAVAPGAAVGARGSLLHPGKPWLLADQPIASVRLKRLRRGLQDVELLRLLERTGKALLARRLAEQVVAWGFLDACGESLIDLKPAGWIEDESGYALARELLYAELTQSFSAAGDSGDGAARPLELLPRLERLPKAAIDGTRLRLDGDAFVARVAAQVLNPGDESLIGSWRLASPTPAGWSIEATRNWEAPPRSLRRASVSLRLPTLSYDAAGVAPLALQFSSPTRGEFSASGRIAVATCPQIAAPLTIDGDLTDWPRGANNAAGDFVRVLGGDEAAPATLRPTLATQAYFCGDSDTIYVAVRCALADGERPVWRTDNRVPIDGPTPWGQDVVELIFDPRETPAASPAELLVLQIKPSGVTLASRGVTTEPPVSPVAPWNCAARVVVGVRSDSWTVEAAIPRAAFGRSVESARVWGVNIARLDARRGEYTSWSGARGTCYSPATLGNLLLAAP